MRRTLATTLLVAMAMVSPVVGMIAWLRLEAEEQVASRREDRVETESKRLRAEIEEMRAVGGRAARSICRLHDRIERLVGGIEAEGATGEPRAPQRDGPAVARWASSMASELGVDLLEVIDATPGRAYGRVRHSSMPERRGRNEKELADALSRAPRGGFVAEITHRRAKTEQTSPAIVHGCWLEGPSRTVVVLAAQMIDAQTLAETLPSIDRSRLRIGDERALRDGSHGVDDGRRILTLEDAGGLNTTTVFLLPEAQDTLDELVPLRPAFYLSIASFFVAILLARILVRSGGAPLDQVEAAVSRIAAGDWSSRADDSQSGELGKLLRELNRMTDELRWTQRRLLRAERIAAWREIARRIAHEIKNPLSPIQVSIETMRKTYAKKHPDFEEIFEESTIAILEEVERLKRIVKEFSDFARMPRPRVESVQIAEVVEHIRAIFSSESVAVELELEELPIVRADREQITQVLMNLVQNAIDAVRDRHGDRGGRVEILAGATEDGVVIAVSDNGPGIASSQRERVFEPYFTTKSSGTGLGLAIVQRIVGDHGGAVEIGEGLDGGTEVRFFLPCEGPPAEAVSTFTDAGTVPSLRRPPGG